MSKYEYRIKPTTSTSSGLVTTYVATLTVVKVPWWKRMLRRRRHDRSSVA